MFVGGLGATAYGFLWALLASVSSLAAIRRPARFRGLIVLIGWALLFTLGPALTQMRGVGFLRTATFGYALLTIPAFIAVEAVHRWLKARS